MDGYKKPEFLEGILDLQNLPPSDQEALIRTIDNFIKATKLKAIQ